MLFCLLKANLEKALRKGKIKLFSYIFGQIGSTVIWELDAKWGRGTFKILPQSRDNQKENVMLSRGEKDPWSETWKRRGYKKGVKEIFWSDWGQP